MVSIRLEYITLLQSKEEHEYSVCLCESQVCRGSYLNLTGDGAFQKERHGVLDRHQLMLEPCELNSVSEEDYIDLGRAGLGNYLLAGFPDWLVAYSVRLMRFINLERAKLPKQIYKHNVEEKWKFFPDIEIDKEVEKSDVEVQVAGVYNQRLQNLALTLDKKHIGKLFGLFMFSRNFVEVVASKYPAFEELKLKCVQRQQFRNHVSN